MDANSQLSFLSTAVQAVGIMLVAGLLVPLTRAIPGRFLRYWSLGWAVLTAGLFSLFASFQFPADPAPRVGFLVGYCLCEYLFAFLLWAGCREAVTGRLLRPIDFAALGPVAVFGVVAPVRLDTFQALFPFHAAVVGLLFTLALVTLRRHPVGPHTPATGLWLMRASLAGLAVMSWHYAAVTGYLVYFRPDVEFGYLSFSALYDVLLETGLAFGMVMLATDRIRGELEAKNRQLARAAAELAEAARTDALTGLLNRRAFDTLLAEQADQPFAGSLAVLDLDDLKPLNDRHGHGAGDVALRLVARALRVHFRVTDPLFRVGGDEFVVVMVGCGEGDLAARMTRVDAGLKAQRLPGLADPLDLKVAWGVAGFASAAGLLTALQRADEAMYACKRQRKGMSRQVVKSSSHQVGDADPSSRPPVPAAAGQDLTT